MSSQKQAKDNGVLSSSVIHYLIHHTFLPPALPQSEDFAPEHLRALLKIVGEGLAAFKLAHSSGHGNAIEAAQRMISRMQAIHMDFGDVNETELKRTLGQLSQKGSKSLLFP